MEHEPSSRETPKEEIVSDLRHLKTDWRDDIPDDIIHSSLTGTQVDIHPDTKFKVRKAWFHILGDILRKVIKSSFINKNYISEKLKIEVITYYKELTKASEFHRRRTTREDINRAEAIMDKVIKELEE